MLRIVVSDTGLEVASSAAIADTFFARLKGLLGTAGLPAGEGLLIPRCNSVHTIGMKYSIDVLFLDKNFTVLKAVAQLAPCRAAVCWQAAMVLELPAGTAARAGLAAGHRLVAHKKYRAMSPVMRGG